ncbi:MAG: caspase family protein [bacterium]
MDTSGSTSTPVEPSSTFSAEDAQVIAHLKIENLTGKHQLRWEWYNPDGSLYCASRNFPVGASKGRYLPQASAWHKLSVHGDKAQTCQGQWVVKVFCDDALIGSAPFSLQAPAEAADLIQLPKDLSVKPYPRDWGLIIGIEDYAHLPKVEYAKKDALIVRDYYMKILGVPEENIIFLIDGDATKARIEGYLRKYIPNNVDKETTLYVYFAGHGAPDIEQGDPFLVPHDGDTQFLAQTGYSLKTFYQDLDNLKVKKVYVFLDSCFSGVASRAAGMLVKGLRPALIHVKDVPLQSEAVVALSASQSGQVSNAYPETKHGLFTYFLLRALRGEADENDDHWVSVKEVLNYVKSHVSRVSHRMGADQVPAIAPPLEILKDAAISRVLK